MLKNDRLLRALRRQPVDCTPIWVMRQAGRYLPEYRATRARAGSFLALAKNPELACEVTLQPLERFELDAAILFSDILTVPDAMGLGLRFDSGEGPRFERPLRSVADIDALGVPDPENELRYVIDAVRTIRAALDGRVPLIGFSGSPWTLACYMVEGGSSKDWHRAKALLWDAPAAAHRLLDTLASAIADYLSAQVAAGAQALMLFDTWGGVLAPAMYREFSLRWMAAVVERVDRGPERAPLVLFSKGCGSQIEAIAAAGADAVGVDWTLDLDEARRRVGGRVAVQGNMDPATLYASPEVVRTEARRILDAWGDAPGHVFNLGHGISPGVDPEQLRVLVDEVHAYSRR